MSWLGWIIAAVVLCPAWWRVAQEADRLRRNGGDSIGRLPRVLYDAAFATVAVIALLAVASVYGRLSHTNATEIEDSFL